jgi:hypothetical protein
MLEPGSSLAPHANSAAKLCALTPSRALWGSGSSPAKTYSSDPGESLIGATFHPKIADPGFFGDVLREIIACNLDARHQAAPKSFVSLT